MYSKSNDATTVLLVPTRFSLQQTILFPEPARPLIFKPTHKVVGVVDLEIRGIKYPAARLNSACSCTDWYLKLRNKPLLMFVMSILNISYISLNIGDVRLYTNCDLVVEFLQHGTKDTSDIRL